MAQNRGGFLTRGNQQQDLTPARQSNWLSPSEFIRMSPWQMMQRMQEDMDRWFGSWGRGQTGNGLTAWQPSVDVSEDKNEWCIEVDLPGVDRNNVDVEVQNDMLRIRAEMRQEQQPDSNNEDRQYIQRERRYGFFERVFPLPSNVNENAIRCDFHNGVLTCHVPKAEPSQQQGRRVPINETGTQQQQQQQHPAAEQKKAA